MSMKWLSILDTELININNENKSPTEQAEILFKLFKEKYWVNYDPYMAFQSIRKLDLSETKFELDKENDFTAIQNFLNEHNLQLLAIQNLLKPKTNKLYWYISSKFNKILP